MLLAVLSASMLRPVELSRMVSRSPSSVTGLCSGAGIPPAGTHAHTYTHTHNALVTTGARLKVLHTYRTGCVRVRTHAGKAMLRSGGAPHQQCTNIHPHMPYGPNKKRTVNVLCLWQCKWMPYGLETTHDLNNDLCMKFSHIKIQHKQKESQRFWWGQKMEWKFQS